MLFAVGWLLDRIKPKTQKAADPQPRLTVPAQIQLASAEGIE
jgi:hypothetical protein